MGLELTVHASEVISAAAILAAGAFIVVVAIVVGGRIERRAATAGISALDERRAGDGEIEDVRTADREAGAIYRRMEQCGMPLVIVDDEYTAVAGIVAWRPAPASDLGELVNRHRRVVSRAWTQRESDALVHRFRAGFELDAYAAELSVVPCSVVEELARRAFGAVEPVSDPHVRRFGQPWTPTELRTLHSARTAGLSVADIARQLGRDQLSTVFRLLESAADAREGVAGEGTAGESAAVTAVGPAGHDREVALQG